MLIFFFGAFVLFGVAFGLLWFANLPRSQRHKQLWSPILAFTFALLCIAGAFFLPTASGAPWRQTLTQSFQQITGLPSPPLSLLILILHGVGILTFAGAKLLVDGTIRLLSRFLSKSLSSFSQLVFRQTDEGMVLRSGWYFPGLLARSTAAVGLGLLLLCIVAQTLFDPLAFAANRLPIPNPGYPLLPGLPAFVLFEIGWYLNGLREEELEEPSPDIDPVDAEIKATYDDLWEEYQEIWSDKVLAASKHPLDRGRNQSSQELVFSEEDPELRTVWRDLVQHPEVQFLNEDDYEVLSRLWTGENLLVEDPTYDRIAPILATALYHDLLEGRKVLFLVDPQRSARFQPDSRLSSVCWVSEWLQTLYGVGDNLRISSLSDFRRKGDTEIPDILVASAEELSSLNILGRGPEADVEWFTDIHKVVALEGARTLFRHAQSSSALLRALQDQIRIQEEEGSLQLVVLSGNRRNLQPSLQQILPEDLFEKRLSFPTPHNPYAICWRTEGPPFQNELFHFFGYEIGAEFVLALPAWREDLSSISIAEQQELPCREFLEELDRNKEQLETAPVAVESLRGRTFERLSCHPGVPWFIPQEDHSFTLVRDRRRNLVRTLQRWLPSGREHAFTHVVSPPYLLRDYFASNIDFFLSVDAPVGLQSPSFSGKTASFVAHQLLRRLMSEWMEAQDIRHILESIGRGDRPVEDALQALFETTFGIDVLGNSILEWNRHSEYRSSKDGFVQKTSFRLRRKRLLDSSSLAWMAFISVVDETEQVLDVVPREHLFQQYLPGQSHAFDGRPYRVEEADLEDQELRVIRDEQWDGRIGYRPDLNVTLSETTSVTEQADTENDWKAIRRLATGEARIETRGYFRLDDEQGSLLPFHQECPSGVPSRNYEDAWIASLAFAPPSDVEDGFTEDELTSISWTLSALLREALPTIFPDASPFLLTLSPNGGTSPLPHVLPEVRYRDRKPLDSAASVYVLEDSQSDLGLAKRLLEHWDDIFGLLDDYVCWILEHMEGESPQSRPEWNVQLEEPTAFLEYGQNTSLTDHDVLDLKATKILLDVFFDEDDTALRNRRRDYYSGGIPVPSPQADQQCDFCRRPIPGAEYEQLNDGRVRCPICSEQATDTEEELKEAYHDARSFLEDTLGRDIAHDVDVTLTDTRAVQEAAGKDFVPTSSFDPRTLGIAIRDQEGLSILVENGQPYYMAKGVIVHELTHIWQFENLNYQRLKSEEGNTLIEGHAKWVELQSIQDIPEAEPYIERQKSRNDEYGVGYRRVCEILDEHPDLDTPFEYLSRHYGKP